MVLICDITPCTLQDYPDHLACILWSRGCNLRCHYCHNPELVLGRRPIIDDNEIWNFLHKRQGLLNAVVVSGGECTLNPNLPFFLERIKSLGFKIKVDTAGSNPSMLRTILDADLADYIALDYKAPKEKYYSITQRNTYDKFSESFSILQQKNIPMEVRTTFHSALLNEDDINNIIDDLTNRKYTQTYYIQNARDGDTISILPPHKDKIEDTLLHTPKTFTLRYRGFKHI